MATQLQIRRGTTAQMNAFTGAEGELAVNTTTDTVHVHDGSTAGGFALAKADGSNIETYAGSFTTLTVDTNTLVVDATNNRVGIGTASPSYPLEVAGAAGDSLTITARSGDATAANNAGGGFRNIGSATATSRSAQMWLDADGANLGGGDYFYMEKKGNSGDLILSQYSNADMIFRVNADQERMRIDASGDAEFSGKVRVGTSTNGAAALMTFDSASNSSALQMGNNSGGVSPGGVLLYSTSSNEFQIYQYSGVVGSETYGGPTLVLNSVGNMGIGISSMVNPLHVGVTPNTASKTSGSAFDGGALRLDGNLANAGDESAILAGSNDGLSAGIGFMRESGANWGTALKFYTHSPAITTTDELTERARLDSSGNLIVGGTAQAEATSVTLNPQGYIYAKSSHQQAAFFDRDNSDGEIVTFRKQGAAVGSISSVGGASLAIAGGNNLLYLNSSTYIAGATIGTLNSGTIAYFKNNANTGVYLTAGNSAWTGASDERLKTVSGEITGGIEKVKAMRPVNFTFNADSENKQRIGFLAQEMVSVVPEVVDVPETETDAITGDTAYWGIQYAEISVVLTAALKEAITKIETLEAKVQTLENN